MTECIRPATERDAPALAAIDARVNPSPWSAASFLESLAHERALVIEAPEATIAGFVLFAVAADECEILSIAVDADAQRRGLGSRLMRAALDAATAAAATRCFLEVRASNAAAQALYRSFGFAGDGRRKQYYRAANGREDALLMSRALP